MRTDKAEDLIPMTEEERLSLGIEVAHHIDWHDYMRRRDERWLRIGEIIEEADIVVSSSYRDHSNGFIGTKWDPSICPIARRIASWCP